MILARDLHPEFPVISARCRELLDGVVDSLTRASLEVPAGDFAAERGKIYRLTDGVLTVHRHGKAVWYLEESDLVGLDLQFWSWDARLTCEATVRCEVYDMEDLFTHLGASSERMRRWTEFLALQSSLMQSALSVALRDEVETQPRIRAVKAGEVIIAQGARAEEVYTLIEGRADVLADGIKVGEVLRDEIFGTLAAFSGGPRTASVVATENSLILSLPRSEFAMLVESRPKLVVKLIEDLARAITALNSRVAQKL